MSLSFKEKVIEYVKKIPKGKVVSYGQVAAACGSSRAARQVGGILGAMDADESVIPWWRVINSQGFISIKGNWVLTKEHQKSLLQKDGVEVDSEFKINMEKYRY